MPAMWVARPLTDSPVRCSRARQVMRSLVPAATISSPSRLRLSSGSSSSAARRIEQLLALRRGDRVVHGAGVDARRPATGDAGVERHRVRVPDLDLDAVEGHLQLLGDDLLDDRVGAGALVEDRRADRDVAVRLEGDLGGADAAARRPLADRDAAADVGALGLVVARGVGRGLQRLFALDAVEDDAERGLVALADQVLHAERHRVHAHGARELVHVRLEREDGLRLAGAAHVAARHRVRVDVRRLDARVGDAVGPGGLLRPEDDAAGLVGRVGAAVDEELDVVRGERAVLLHAGAQRITVAWRGLPARSSSR